MPGWNKKTEGVEVTNVKEEETPLEEQKGVVKDESSEAQRVYEEKLYEIEYRRDDGIKWASNLLGTIHRALDYRENVAVREQDIEQLQFYITVLSYTSSETLAKAFLKLESEERAKMENDVSVS